MEVLDFNVFLSPFDVWTAAITAAPHVSGSGDEGGEIATSDLSCTIRALRRACRSRSVILGSNRAMTPLPARPKAYRSVRNGDRDRCYRGQGPARQRRPGLRHHQRRRLGRPGTPSGGLFGGITIVNPAGGGAFSQAATALANFNPTAAYQTTGSLSPQYSDAVPVSNVIQGTKLYSSVWGNGNNAVTAVLLGNAITNEYVLDAGTKSQTSWVITMPTKYAYVNGAVTVPPFTSKYVSKKGACEPTFGVVFNREEASRRTYL